MMSCRFLLVLLACALVRAQDATLESRVDTLEKDRVKERIAFSAALFDTQGTWTPLGPFDDVKTLEFKRVVTNVGGAYSPDTGIFTAPMKGVYHFQLTGVAGPTGELHAAVKKSRETMFAIYQKAGTQASATNSMFMELEQGDQVYAQLWAGKTIADQGRLSTFSGFLVFAL